MKKLILIFLLLISITCNKYDISKKEAPLCNIVDNQSISRLSAAPAKPKPGMVLLDFDGYGAYTPSSATESDKTEIKRLIDSIYRAFEFQSTFDESIYNSFIGLRQRVVFTNNDLGFTGASIIGSMATGDTSNPVLINWMATRYVSCCYNNIPNVYASWVASHEIGHTLMLYHQVRDCSENYATTLNGFSPLMGSTLNATSTGWVNGNGFFVKTPICPTSQDDIGTMAKYLKKKR